MFELTILFPFHTREIYNFDIDLSNFTLILFFIVRSHMKHVEIFSKKYIRKQWPIKSTRNQDNNDLVGRVASSHDMLAPFATI